jgi:hypothetical protein
MTDIYNEYVYLIFRIYVVDWQSYQDLEFINSKYVKGLRGIYE